MIMVDCWPHLHNNHHDHESEPNRHRQDPLGRLPRKTTPGTTTGTPAARCTLRVAQAVMGAARGGRSGLCSPGATTHTRRATPRERRTSAMATPPPGHEFDAVLATLIRVCITLAGHLAPFCRAPPPASSGSAPPAGTAPKSRTRTFENPRASRSPSRRRRDLTRATISSGGFGVPRAGQHPSAGSGGRLAAGQAAAGSRHRDGHASTRP